MLRIIIIEDSADDAELIERHLQDAGVAFDDRVIDTAEELRRQLIEDPPDVVLSDHAMPSFSSDLALAIVQELAPETPFIIVSGAIGEEAAVDALRRGATDYVSKDNLRRLDPAVTRAVEERRARHERDLAEQRERQSAAHARALFEHATDTILVLDDHAVCVDVNAAGAAHMGLQREQIVGRSIDQILLTEDSDGFALSDRLTRGETSHGEARLRSSQEEDVEVEFDSVFHFVAGRTMVIAHDVTAHKRAEAALKDAHVKAIEASETKSAFLANMSHEIRTPLNGVIGTVQLLRTTPLSDEQREYVHHAEASASALLAVIDDVLDFSKIEAGRVDLRHEPFDTCNLVENVREMLAPSADSRGIGLRTASPGVQIAAYGDSERTRQVLINLVANAIKFTSEGEVVIRVIRADQAVRVEVADTGIGIAPDVAARLFEPFTQADASTTRGYGGTGLGLAISKRLVTLMGGRIGLDSIEGRGSCFWFTLPVATVAGTVTDADAVPAEIPSPLDGTGWNGAAVLVAEDHPVNQFVARRMLEKSGLRPVIAGDGRQAVDLACSGQFSAILMDCQMPEFDGYQATAEIRRREPPGVHVPIIAMTAHALEGDREKCLAAGMDDYLSKPVQQADLERMLGRFLPAPAPDLAPAPPTAPTIDGSVLDEITDADAEVRSQLVSLYLTRATDCLDDLINAVAEADLARIRRQGHSLHGSSATVGAVAMSAACDRLSAAARAGDFDDIATVVGSMRETLERTQQHMVAESAVTGDGI